MRLTKALVAALSLLAGTGGIASAVTVADLEEAVVLSEETIADIQEKQEYAMDVSGYADVEFIRTDDNSMGFRMHHVSLFFQKKISQKWSFFSEIEFEDALKHDFSNSTISGQQVAVGDASGSLFVEGMSFDYQWSPQATFRLGRFYTPSGIWSIDRYPPFLTTQERPAHIRQIFPQFVDGAMMLGTLMLGSSFMDYHAYVSNGEGNVGKEDLNNAKAVGVNANIKMRLATLRHFEIGGSAYIDPSDSSVNDERKIAVGMHLRFRLSDLIVQAEGAASQYSSAPQRLGYYAQLAYAPNRWSGGYRYDSYDEDLDSSGNKITHTLFVNYRATPNVVLKLEHHFVDEGNGFENKTIASIAAYLD
jgi:hypothetical protein